MGTKVCFWLYEGETRITGLYGMFCQFTCEPKVYTLSDEQKRIVFANLKDKLQRLDGDKSLDGVPVLEMLWRYADSAGNTKSFDQVRIYTVDDELLEVFNIVRISSIENGDEIRFIRADESSTNDNT